MLSLASTFVSASSAYSSAQRPAHDTYDSIVSSTLVSGNQSNIEANCHSPKANGNVVCLNSAGDWQYGLSMSPPVTYYDVAEMPTAGMFWNTAPSNVMFMFWVSSTTGDGWFLQVGYVYNGFSYWICINNCAFGGNIPPHSWGLFYTYEDPTGTYYGTGIPIPSGWQPGDHIYFSVAVYIPGVGPGSGHNGPALEFLIDDHSRGTSTLATVCPQPNYWPPPPGQQLTGGVGGIAEDPNNAQSGYGNIHVDQVTLWAENVGGNIRYSNNVYAYDSGSPQQITTYKYPNWFGEFQVGFNKQGSHITSGTLFSGSATYGLEDVPPDNCP